MVNYYPAALDATFSARADPTRRAILARLALGEATVTELATPFRMSLPAVSKHLRILEDAGLLERKVEGRLHRLQLQAKPMEAAAEWIERYRRFWEEKLNALARYFENLHPKEKGHERKSPKNKQAHSRPPRKGLRGVDRS
jgi:DNA-binding transcriptional ArsR family regulator